MITWKAALAPNGKRIGYFGNIDAKNKYLVTKNLMTGHHVIFLNTGDEDNPQKHETIYDKLITKKDSTVAQETAAYNKLKEIAEKHSKGESYD